MKNQSVAQGRFVEIEYVLSEAIDGGEVIEDCPAEQAFGFTMGAGEVLEAFEKIALQRQIFRFESKGLKSCLSRESHFYGEDDKGG